MATLHPTDRNEVLMFFLMKHGLPIASSCAGDGVCKKCKMSDETLSCQLSVSDLADDAQIEFDYL